MVTRYDLHQVHLCGQQPRGEMKPTEDGEWVLLDDYNRAADALRKCEEYLEEFSRIEYYPGAPIPFPSSEMKLLDLVIDALRSKSGVKECATKRQGTAIGNDTADCGWPFCGCDPHADKVIAAIEESGFKIVPSEPTEAMTNAAMHDFDTPFCDDLERIYRCMVGAASVDVRP